MKKILNLRGEITVETGCEKVVFNRIGEGEGLIESYKEKQFTKGLVYSKFVW